DVRSKAEFRTGHLAGAVNIPLWNLSGALNQLDKSQPLVVYCRSGHRSALALRTLRSAGFPKAKHLAGGTGAWSRAGFPLES
ncbi:MAG: rhodanese-like domain-containing protein, partial [bacterium]